MTGISANVIRSMTDYVLLNAYSVNTSGLYEGKSGHALCLFEMSRYFNDETIEEHAFELLQEALVTKTKRIDFGSGLSGIGYVLLYLINNRFIDDDFDEFFGNQQALISDTIRSHRMPGQFLHSVLFLMESEKRASDPKLRETIRWVMDDALDRFIIDFTEEKWRINPRKKFLLDGLSELFRILYLLKRSNIGDGYTTGKLERLCKLYCGLYTRNVLINRYDCGFYLEHLCSSDDEKQLAVCQCRQALSGVATDTLDLCALIRLSVQTSVAEPLQDSAERFARLLRHTGIPEMERLMDYRITLGKPISSLKYGVPLYLLYFLYKQRVENDERLIPILI